MPVRGIWAAPQRRLRRVVDFVPTITVLAGTNGAGKSSIGGATIARLLTKAHANGLRVRVWYCGLMQAELALRCREDIENGPVRRRVVGHDMAEQSGRGARKRVRRHCPILAGWRSAPPVIPLKPAAPLR
jgi:predicted ABC-type ATPase